MAGILYLHLKRIYEGPLKSLYLLPNIFAEVFNKQKHIIPELDIKKTLGVIFQLPF